MKVLYLVIDGDITGGNLVCLSMLDEAVRLGWSTILVSPRDGPFCERVRERGVPVHLIDTTRSFRFDSAVRLARLAAKEGVSLIHAHAPFAGTVIARIAGKLAGIPVITHAHVRETYSRNRLIRLYQRAMTMFSTAWSGSRVIAVSRAARDSFVTQGTNPKSIGVIYNGVDIPANPPSRETARSALGIPEKSPVVIQIGRLCESKGQHLLIRATKEILRHHPDLTVLIVGDDLVQGGEYRSELQRLAASEGVAEKIRFLGVRSDIENLLAASDVLVLPSSIEGLPLVVLEAMASGRAVVASAVDGNVELVSDGETGRLIPEGDAGALADALIDLISEPDKARRWGMEGRRVAQERFSRERMLAQTFEVYGQLAGSTERR